MGKAIQFVHHPVQLMVDRDAPAIAAFPMPTSAGTTGVIVADDPVFVGRAMRPSKKSGRLSVNQHRVVWHFMFDGRLAEPEQTR